MFDTIGTQIFLLTEAASVACIKPQWHDGLSAERKLSYDKSVFRCGMCSENLAQSICRSTEFPAKFSF